MAVLGAALPVAGSMVCVYGVLVELQRTLLNSQVFKINVSIYTGSHSSDLIYPETWLCFFLGYNCACTQINKK